ncbi:DNA-3-methyladenine glycosylase [Pseudoflavitalea sp. G-6-1-2]|uniref:DNA-3-methyladenine glycosylase n=1 Tax=Pseudoflavitalea sp. G-6-1-2 TaxID=2728841 RepID=UPI00146AC0EE|nr:DNA-3-methyladenine glycosylase [Pseudoflavitalea sp. G-6-1-2]NML19379.1 DNA-3-methyladenine glycosylase [Pseudoflavitalea sp. G-6-1-2]
MKKLNEHFYDRPDVVQIAKELLGKILVTSFDGQTTAGRIVETEAYAGETDRASHAWNGRRTNRTEVMYGKPGTAYVYLCYGIHQMFNVVTNRKDVPHAILVRALEPVEGKEIMFQRFGVSEGQRADKYFLTKGPGNVGRALGLHTSHTGTSLHSKELYIADDGMKYEDEAIGVSPRIGVDYAGDHAAWLYRFYVKGNKYVSGKIR